MDENPNANGQAGDPLAEIIRAAGARTAPPRAHYDQVYAAARASWRKALNARRQRRWLALAASLAVVALAAALMQIVVPGNPATVAEISVVEGSAEWLPADGETWAVITGSGIANGDGPTSAGISSSQRLDDGARIRTGADGRVALRLADGGSLRLHAQTEIVLGRNELELTAGRLYFDSAGRPDTLPIAVATSLGTVRDIGTQFEIRASRDDLRIRVRSGGIEVRDPLTDQNVIAEAGEQLLLSADRSLARSAFAPDGPEWSWAEALATIPVSRSILEYLEWIANETGKQLRFETGDVQSSARGATFSGDPSGMTPYELLENITLTSDFGYELTDDGTLVINRTDN